MTDMATPVSPQPTEAELHDQYIRNNQARITESEVLNRVYTAIVEVFTNEVDEGIEKETAKRMLNAIADRLGITWDNPFVNKYLVKVYLDYDKVMEVEVEADDEDEAESDVSENLSFENLQITGTLSYKYGEESDDFECDLSEYDYDLESRLTYRVSEAD